MSSSLWVILSSALLLRPLHARRHAVAEIGGAGIRPRVGPTTDPGNGRLRAGTPIEVDTATASTVRLVRLSRRRTIMWPRLLATLLGPRGLAKAAKIIIDAVDGELRVAALSARQARLNMRGLSLAKIILGVVES